MAEVSEAFLKQLEGYGLTTAQIIYRMPDHLSLCQEFVWQEYDLYPKFPELSKFLAFWEETIEGPLQSRYYYLYGEDAQRGGRWTGPINMCIAEKEFKIVGYEDCFARGFQRAGFQEHDTGNQSNWMIQLTDRPVTGDEPPPQAPADAPAN